MGLLAVLLQWHVEDPVDAFEQTRNDVIFIDQGNRNPFIDHPEWVECLFGGVCLGGCDIPADCNDGLFCNGVEDCNAPNCVSGIDPCPGQNCDEGSQSCAECFNDPQCDDGLFCNGAETCVGNVCQAGSDPCGGETCDEATDRCGGGPGIDPWINELHYDNAATDVGEFVEIAGPAGLDLAGWQVLGHTGNGGGLYNTLADLTGIIPDQGGCIGTLWFDFTPMQNGSPDGLALVDPSSTVIEFISYEGSFVATEGPATGLTSVDINVAESFTTPIGDSLQLAGTGGVSSDFTWQPSGPDTRGLPNTGQTFVSSVASEAVCDDGIDNDCDGLTDCAHG